MSFGILNQKKRMPIVRYMSIKIEKNRILEDIQDLLKRTWFLRAGIKPCIYYNYEQPQLKELLISRYIELPIKF